jgi:hypothetical protein
MIIILVIYLLKSKQNMAENVKKLSESAILSAALDKCRELHFEASDGEPNEESKREAHIIGIGELSRWKENPAKAESIIAELYPEEDPKFYFATLEYVLRHFDTLYDAVQKSWIKENGTKEKLPSPNKGIASTSRGVQEQVHDILLN